MASTDLAHVKKLVEDLNNSSNQSKIEIEKIVSKLVDLDKWTLQFVAVTGVVPALNRVVHQIESTVLRNMVERCLRYAQSLRPLEINPKIKASAAELARKGNSSAENSDFSKAIHYYTKAIEKNPLEYRLYGNRSFCFIKLLDFQSALADAKQALILKPEWAKGYFRKGEALAGIQSVLLYGEKDYAEAERAFLKALKFDKKWDDPIIALRDIRVQQFMAVGFTEREAREMVFQQGAQSTHTPQDQEVYESDDEEDFQSEPLIPDTGLLQDHFQSGPLIPDDAVLQEHFQSGPLIPDTGLLHDDFQSGALIADSATLQSDFQSAAISSDASALQTDDTWSVWPKKSVAEKKASRVTKGSPKGADYDRKMDPTNPDGLKAIWVGNVQDTKSEKDLKQLFSKAGTVTGIRLMVDKSCAFVNFNSTQEAGKAMEKFQGYPFGSLFLVIKFPDHPINTPVGVPVPVNDGECYYWRTSTCKFDSSCKFKHIEAHKGIDAPNK